MDKLGDYQEAKELMRDCMRSMEKGNTRLHSRIKFDNDEVIKLRVGGGTTIHQQVLHPQVGMQILGGNFHHGMNHCQRCHCHGHQRRLIAKCVQSPPVPRSS